MYSIMSNDASENKNNIATITMINASCVFASEREGKRRNLFSAREWKNWMQRHFIACCRVLFVLFFITHEFHSLIYFFSVNICCMEASVIIYRKRLLAKSHEFWVEAKKDKKKSQVQLIISTVSKWEVLRKNYRWQESCKSIFTATHNQYLQIHVSQNKIRETNQKSNFTIG